MKTIDILKSIIGGLDGAKMHLFHSIICERQGFTKLSKKMREEYDEEMEDVATMTRRILDLGGNLDIKIESYPLYYDVEQMIREEAKMQSKAVDEFLTMLKEANDMDPVTQDILTEYIAAEEEHLRWLESQVKMIDTIGLQNYLVTQI
ncbi:ferritin-like domain-containing protein [Prevotella dentasini]|uniref:ferritin-like domain-containing protein n=1 Tax=Prevotella dentasini TaxID=589537 RepID=UPI0004699B50|nr:ferritin-like domain-containing protein [Prevotella dentasini]